GVSVADVAHAMGRLLEPVTAASGQCLSAVSSMYDFVSSREGPFGDDDEREVISGRFAFLAWDHCRQLERFREMRTWEERCETHVLSQSAVRDYFLIRDPARRASLASKFLVNPETILMILRRGMIDPNANPAADLDFFLGIFAWLDQGLAPVGED